MQTIGTLAIMAAIRRGEDPRIAIAFQRFAEEMMPARGDHRFAALLVRLGLHARRRGR